MLRRLLAAGALGSLAGCVVGPGYGYYEPGYALAPGYGAAPEYGYASAYDYPPAYGQVGVVVNGSRDARAYHNEPPRADWHGTRDDRGGRAAPTGGYAGPQPGQATAAMRDGRDANWRGANPGVGGAGQQGHLAGGSRQDANGSGGRPRWQGNGNEGNGRW